MNEPILTPTHPMDDGCLIVDLEHSVLSTETIANDCSEEPVRDNAPVEGVCLNAYGGC